MSDLITCIFHVKLEKITSESKTQSVSFWKVLKKKIRREKPSSSLLTCLLPKEIISGKHIKCNFTINPLNETITIKGNSREKIEECARHITRTLTRKQEWGFHYIEYLHKSSGRGRGAIYIPVKASVSAAPYQKKEDFIIDIQNEYELPTFLELLFREGILNYSAKKPRIAFLLIYSTLERAVNLLYEHHCKLSYSYRVEIDHKLKTLKNDPIIHLKVNLKDFDNKSNFRDIRNTVTHGRREFKNKSIKIEEEVKSLITTVDSIFRPLSGFLNSYKHHL